MERFAPEEVSELIAQRRAVRGALMRVTIHLVSAPDWARLRPLLEPVMARGFSGSPFSRSSAGVDLSQVLRYGRELLSERPRSRAELAPAPSRFLAPFDNAILAHADRARIIPADCRAAVKRDRLMRTCLLDGFVAGNWRLDGAALHVHPADPLMAKDIRELIGEAEQLAGFLAVAGSAPEVQVHRPGN